MSATYYPKKAGLSPIAYIVERNLKYELRVAYNIPTTSVTIL